MKVFPGLVEQKLGFDSLRERLGTLTLSALGRDRLDAMRLSSDLAWIQAEVERVWEIQQAIRFDDPLPLHHVLDIRAVLSRAAPEGSYIAPDELADTRRVLITLRLIHQYFQRRQSKYPRTVAITSRIRPQPALEDKIAEIVDDEGRIRDTASPELHRLRRLIVQRQARLRETLLNELRSAVREGFATEEQPTMRNGRMVIPVRAEAKRKIEGFVQDISASGQTVYVEPAACLELNNELRELEGEERREVERILKAITAEIRTRIDDLREGVAVLARFDLLQAKARLSNQIDAVVPRLNDNGVIEIRRGRNPVLQLRFQGYAEERREVVPLNMDLGATYRTLIITGPNAGGKTVAMKTVGLFALMLAYGLPLPLDESSQFSIFERLHVDIGDEQSIEEDLSTFSSHVSNLKFMLDQAGKGTLVLIDEAGTGTDPSEGGALAQSVLERLTERGARTIATTHHGTLKVFAHETEGVENGSMEFDQATLSPTYRFQPGVPGSSYAFEIASRIGLDEKILERARALVGRQKTSLEQLIATFEARTQELDAQLAEAEKEARQARHEREQYQQRAEKLKREREDIRRQALEEAERIVQSANARVERTIREIKEAQAEKEATRAAREELEAFRAGLEGRAAKKEPAPKEERGPRGRRAAKERRQKRTDAGPIEVGDQVVLDNGTTAAEVLEISNGEAVISFDSMKLRADLRRLRKIGGKRKQQVRLGRVEQSSVPSLTAQSRIDLRGRRVDEALDSVARLIDQALMSGLDQLEILHGTGTGALRKAIHEYLAGRPDVFSFEEAPWEQGGAGVTHIHLR